MRAVAAPARGAAVGRGLAFAVAAAALAAGIALLSPAVLREAPVWVSLAAGALYLLAHGLRALRLAMLAVPLLGVSGRSAALLHLATAPVTLLLPLKLGELVRLHQLAVMSRQVANAVVVLVLDRMFDALLLIPIIILLAMTEPAFEVGAPVLVLTAAAAILSTIMVVLGPGVLGSLQRYIVIHHGNPRMLRRLPALDRLRRVTAEGAMVVRAQAAQLGLLSALIWTSELAAAWLFARFGASADGRSAGALLMDRLADASAALGLAGTDPALAASAGSGLLALLAIWPVALLLYFRRMGSEPRRRPPSVRAPIVDAGRHAR